jgi:hypothetical protein
LIPSAFKPHIWTVGAMGSIPTSEGKTSIREDIKWSAVRLGGPSLTHYSTINGLSEVNLRDRITSCLPLRKNGPTIPEFR